MSVTSAAAIGGALSFIGGERANRSRERSTARQIAFQKESIQNRHQWETQDLQKAGLNRILGFAKGGSPPSAQGASTKYENTLKSAPQTALALAQAAKLKAETVAINQQNVKGKSESDYYDTPVGDFGQSVKKSYGQYGPVIQDAATAYGAYRALKAYNNSKLKNRAKKAINNFKKPLYKGKFKLPRFLRHIRR